MCCVAWWEVCGVGVIRCFQGGVCRWWVGCVQVVLVSRGWWFSNKPSTYLVVLAVVACTQFETQLHATTARTTRYVLGLLLNHHLLYTNTTCTHTTHHLPTPPWKHLITPTPHTSHQATQHMHHIYTQYTRSDMRIRYQLNTTVHIYTRNPDYVYNSLLHTKTRRISHLTVFPSSCYSAEHHMRKYTALFSWWWA